MGLIRILIIAGIALVVVMVFRRIVAGPLRARAEREEDERLGRLVQDPQCGVYVDSREAVRRKVAGGELYFCSKACARDYLEAQKQG